MDGAQGAGVERFRAALRARGFPDSVLELPDSTRTAPEAARAIGCQVEQICKSLIFRGVQSGQAVLVIASGANRVDVDLLGAHVSEPVRIADPEFVLTRAGYPIGAVPPFGHPDPLPTFLDEDLLQFDAVWASAGDTHAVFELTPAELQRLTGGQVIAIK